MRGPSKCDDEHPTGKEGFKLWMVSAWSAANGISLGQVKVDDKSNEITAVPLLIHALDLDDCIITIDAMGCQLEITKAIINRNSNYIIALKKNQKKSYELARKSSMVMKTEMLSLIGLPGISPKVQDMADLKQEFAL